MPIDSSAPRNCTTCGVEHVREKSYHGLRCADCYRRAGRDSMRRTMARVRGEDVPKQPFGPKPTPFPFPCGKCGTMVEDASNRYGIGLECVACGRERRRRDKLRDRYGLTAEAWAAMWWECQGKCSACGEEPDEGGLVVDHDHATGAVRALICRPCNWAIGYAQESPARLRAAADYLEEHGLLTPDRSSARSRAVA